MPSVFSRGPALLLFAVVMVLGGIVDAVGSLSTPGALATETTESLVAGRVVMVVATLLSGALLWMIARRLGLSLTSAAVALAIFFLSPLALQLHRPFHYSNIAAVFLLAGLLLGLHRSWRTVVVDGAWFCFAAAAVLLLVPGTSDAALFGNGSGQASTIAEAAPGWVAGDPILLVSTLVAASVGLFIRRLRWLAVLLLIGGGALVFDGQSLPSTIAVALLPIAALVIVGVASQAAVLLRPRSGPGGDVAPNSAGLPGARAAGVLLVGLATAAVTLAVSAWVPAAGEFVGVAATGAGSTQAALVGGPEAAPLSAPAPSGASSSAAGGASTDSSSSAAGGASTGSSSSAAGGASTGTSGSAAGGTSSSASTAAPSAATTGADTGAGGGAVSSGQGVVAARTFAGTQLASNSDLTLSAAARALLQAGRVDARSVLSLGQLVGETALTVGDFPAVSTDTDAATGVRRQILVTERGGVPVGSGGSASSDTAAASVEAWFRSLRGAFDVDTVVRNPSGVLVTFAPGEPTELLPTPAPSR